MSEILEVDLNGKRRLPLELIKASVIPAKTGWSHLLRANQYLRLTDTYGKQAADFWAFNAGDLDEHLSAMHTRVWLNKLCPGPGESFHSNHRRPILQLIADSCGVHDLLTAACDEHRYRQYGVEGGHPSCVGNLRLAMKAHFRDEFYVPQPVNFFMSVAVLPDGRVETGANPSKPGDHVVLKAWFDCVVAISACPQEFNPAAGWYPSDLHAAIYEAAQR